MLEAMLGGYIPLAEPLSQRGFDSMVFRPPIIRAAPERANAQQRITAQGVIEWQEWTPN